MMKRLGKETEIRRNRKIGNRNDSEGVFYPDANCEVTGCRRFRDMNLLSDVKLGLEIN
jgi:hypothetical protein